MVSNSSLRGFPTPAIEPVTKHWLLVNRSYLSHLQEFESNFFVLAKGALEIIDA